MIQVSHLTKVYGRRTAVQDLSFTVEDGQICGLLGPNGAGKSTVMNILTGYIAPTSGSVSVEGHPLPEEAAAARACVGYLPETPPLYPDMTVAEYLRFAAELKGVRRAGRAAAVAAAARRTGVEDVLPRLIRSLSKGYRQRVGIAQALLGNPRYIILDEPTVGLDPLQIIEIRDLIRELGQKHTVILSSHILSEVQAICESVLIIAHGKLVAFDTPRNLEKMLAANNRLSIVAETDEAGLRAILDGQAVVADYTVEPGEQSPAAPEPAAPGAPAEQPAQGDEAAPTAPVQPAPVTCKATLTLAGDPTAACRTLFFAFAKAGCALLQMTAIKADLENIFIELTEDEPSGKEAAAHESGV